MNDEFERILNQISDISVTKTQLVQFKYFYNELNVWNDRMNLTGSTDKEKIYFDHFLDSLFPAYIYKKTFFGHKNVLDVGTGAGFPGLPIKILFPKIKICLLESIGKKTEFLNHVVSSMGLKDVKIIYSRAENVAHDSNFREQFDVVLSRAVAKLSILSEITIPFTKPGGDCIFFKGNNPDNEILEAEEAISILGGKINNVFLKSEDMKLSFRGSLINVRKIGSTPVKYPRKSRNLKKNPLGHK